MSEELKENILINDDAQDNNNADDDINRGIAYLKSQLATMETTYGVYQMMDEKNRVLYIGKAKNLKKRIESYTRERNLSMRISLMISKLHKLQVMTTLTEQDALNLERSLIKSLKPRYNIIFRDDKTYPSIYINTKHEYPRISKYRGDRKEKGKYYGPFTDIGAVNKTIELLQKAFLLRNCSDSEFARTTKPCIYYQIKQCLAPCVEYCDRQEYSDNVKQTVDFLDGNSNELQMKFAQYMQESSDNMEYEEAGMWRDRIKALTEIQSTHKIQIKTADNIDMIGIYKFATNTCIEIFKFKNGCSYGNKEIIIKTPADYTESEILVEFVNQYYESNELPKYIYLSHEVDSDNLFLPENTSLKIPQKGYYKELMQQVLVNAEQKLVRDLSNQNQFLVQIMQMCERLDIKAEINRIEVYDNSHHSGEHAIGAMVVATKQGWDKSAYRKFNIKAVDYKAGDDYGMMQEVLKRRFERLNNKDTKFGDKPDIILIDGGKGQLNMVYNLLQDYEYAKEIIIMSIAKGTTRKSRDETIYIKETNGNILSFKLDTSDNTQRFMQLLRDEAHSYAIGVYRRKHVKNMFNNPLDNIPGIGAKRKKQLLHHFGSAKKIQNSTIEDIMKVDGVTKKASHHNQEISKQPLKTKHIAKTVFLCYDLQIYYTNLKSLRRSVM